MKKLDLEEAIGVILIAAGLLVGGVVTLVASKAVKVWRKI